MKRENLSRIRVCYIAYFVLFLLSNTFMKPLATVTFFLILFTILFNRNEENISLLFFLLPNLTILNGAVITKPVNILYVAIGIKYILTRKMTRKGLIGAIVLFFVEFWHSLYYTNVSEQLFSAINASFDFLVAILLLTDHKSKTSFITYADFLTYGIYNSVLVFAIAEPKTFMLSVTEFDRLEAYGNDPNYFSVYLLVSLCFAYYRLMTDKTTMRNAIRIILLCVIGLLTASKMCILCIVGTTALYVASVLHKSSRRAKRNTAVLVVFVLTATFFARDEIGYLVERFLGRFAFSGQFKSTMAMVTTGRSDSLLYYLNLLKSDPMTLLFGKGMMYLQYFRQNMQVSAVNKFLVWNTVLMAHNTYMDAILSWGVLGSATIFGYLYYCIRGCGQLSNQPGIKRKLPLITFSIALLSLSCLSAHMFWYVVALVLMPYKNIYATDRSAYIW